MMAGLKLLALVLFASRTLAQDNCFGQSIPRCCGEHGDCPSYTDQATCDGVRVCPRRRPSHLLLAG